MANTTKVYAGEGRVGRSHASAPRCRWLRVPARMVQPRPALGHGAAEDGAEGARSAASPVDVPDDLQLPHLRARRCSCRTRFRRRAPQERPPLHRAPSRFADPPEVPLFTVRADLDPPEPGRSVADRPQAAWSSDRDVMDRSPFLPNAGPSSVTDDRARCLLDDLVAFMASLASDVYRAEERKSSHASCRAVQGRNRPLPRHACAPPQAGDFALSPGHRGGGSFLAGVRRRGRLPGSDRGRSGKQRALRQLTEGAGIGKNSDRSMTSCLRPRSPCGRTPATERPGSGDSRSARPLKGHLAGSAETAGGSMKRRDVLEGRAARNRLN